MSSPVLITDDHKTTVKRAAKRPRIDPDLDENKVVPAFIQKVVPNIGPVSGGIEVTLLGSGFVPGQAVFFGPYSTPAFQYKFNLFLIF